MNKKSASASVVVIILIFLILVFGLLLWAIKSSNDFIASGRSSINIDKCEYFQNVTQYGYSVYTHKGSCTNCWDRMEKLVRKEKLKKE